MAHSIPTRLARRQFALTGLALGGAALMPRAAEAQGAPAVDSAAQAPARPAQASGPIVLHGVSPRLTVHALDTFHGAAATGLRVDFSRLSDGQVQPLRSIVINANGRSDEPLLIGDSYQSGDYELLLHVGDYFAGRQARLPAPAFLTQVPVRIRVVNVAERIHLPIQFGPWSYTYSRGS
ncbi:hydroxyisourate hydrolase [Pseudorhodoferax sp. Leaf274]|uniref:hydroxyisourate hydrolase n=1 Tax=Pseudorhodoferax sp. Leaf274 TaxID=1736318 RepID=UPI0007030401|nr:hydroxyisourate hydrolase [Pseudorhodoferax sp. Leaf274]KQP49666.1 5-hydroxyisourate hydrolase [Pseudorhodoferax sp. Leaf274]